MNIQLSFFVDFTSSFKIGILDIVQYYNFEINQMFLRIYVKIICGIIFVSIPQARPPVERSEI